MKCFGQMSSATVSSRPEISGWNFEGENTVIVQLMNFHPPLDCRVNLSSGITPVFGARVQIVESSKDKLIYFEVTPQMLLSFSSSPSDHLVDAPWSCRSYEQPPAFD